MILGILEKIDQREILLEVLIINIEFKLIEVLMILYK
jgi:hypothetical protein